MSKLDSKTWKCEADQKAFEDAMAALNEPEVESPEVLEVLKGELLQELDTENICSQNIWDLVQEIEAEGGFIELMF